MLYPLRTKNVRYKTVESTVFVKTHVSRMCFGGLCPLWQSFVFFGLVRSMVGSDNEFGNYYVYMV